MNSNEDKKIIEEVLDVLQISYETHKYFIGGAVSRVILLNNKYLIKQNSNLEAELEFFKYNKLEMFQKIVHIDSNLKYVVYSFIDGTPMLKVDDCEDTINKIIKITSSYSNYDKEGYGYYLERVSTWEDFLQSEIQDSSKNIKEYIKDDKFVNQCINVLKEYKFVKKIIHGDFGTHNFIKEKGKMIGVIDPDTVIGDALYDTLFAIVSNIDILKNVTFESLCIRIKEDKRKIYALLVIVLYSRISRCLKYHKEDIEIYMNFWNDLIKYRQKLEI